MAAPVQVAQLLAGDPAGSEIQSTPSTRVDAPDPSAGPSPTTSAWRAMPLGMTTRAQQQVDDGVRSLAAHHALGCDDPARGTGTSARPSGHASAPHQSHWAAPRLAFGASMRPDRRHGRHRGRAGPRSGPAGGIPEGAVDGADPSMTQCQVTAVGGETCRGQRGAASTANGPTTPMWDVCHVETRRCPGGDAPGHGEWIDGGMPGRPRSKRWTMIPCSSRGVVERSALLPVAVKTRPRGRHAAGGGRGRQLHLDAPTGAGSSPTGGRPSQGCQGVPYGDGHR